MNWLLLFVNFTALWKINWLLLLTITLLHLLKNNLSAFVTVTISLLYALKKYKYIFCLFRNDVVYLELVTVHDGVAAATNSAIFRLSR